MLPTTTRYDVLRALQFEMNSILSEYNTVNNTTIPCFYSNTVEKVPSDLSTFLKLSINMASDTLRLDDITDSQAGIATIQVAVKLGTGLNESARISDAVESGFKLLHWEEDVLTIDKTGIHEIGANGSSYLTNVNVYFQYNRGK